MVGGGSAGPSAGRLARVVPSCHVQRPRDPLDSHFFLFPRGLRRAGGCFLGRRRPPPDPLRASRSRRRSSPGRRARYLYTEDGRRILDFTSGQMSGDPRPLASRRSWPPCGARSARLDHLFSGMLSRPVVDLARRLAETLPAPLAEGPAADHRRGVERGRGPDGQAGHRWARDRLLRRVVARHDPGGRARRPTARAARATARPPRATSRSPTPNAYRPDFTDADGELDWQRQLDLGFDLIDAQSVGSLAACLVEPILSSGGVIEPPPGYFAALQRQVRRAGHAADPRRGADRAVPHRRPGTRSNATASSPTSSPCPRRSAPGCRSPPCSPAPRSRSGRTSAASCSTPRTCPIRCSPRSATPSWTCSKRDRLDGAPRELGAHLRRGPAGDPGSAPRSWAMSAGGACCRAWSWCVDRETKRGADQLGAAVTRRCLELGLHMNVVQLPGHGRHLPDRPAADHTDGEIAWAGDPGPGDRRMSARSRTVNRERRAPCFTSARPSGDIGRPSVRSP